MALVRRIRAESDLTPIAFSGRYGGSYFRLMTTFSQCGFLTTPGGKDWAARFEAGQASSQEGFGEGLAILQDLIDAGAFDEADRQSRDDDVYEKLIGRTAAFGVAQAKQSLFAEMMADSQDQFGAIPYYGKEEEQRILSSTVGFNFGLGRQLGEKGNEEKLQQALQIMDYLSTEEGQRAMMNGVSDVLPLAASSLSDAFQPYQDMGECVAQGRVASYLYSGYEDVVMQAAQAIEGAMFEGTPLMDAVPAMDKARQDALNATDDSYLATVERTLTPGETAQFMADVLLAQGGGDLSLVSIGGCVDGVYNPSGVNGKLYQGKIHMNDYNVILPGRLGAALVNVTMTGEDIIALVERGRRVEDEQTGAAASFDYYWAGLEVAWEKGAVKAAVLPGGVPLEPGGRYQVSMAANDFDARQFPQAAETGTTVADAYLAYLQSHGQIQPPVVGRP